MLDKEQSYILKMDWAKCPSHLKTHDMGETDGYEKIWVSGKKIMDVILTDGSKSDAFDSSETGDFLEDEIYAWKKSGSFSLAWVH